MGGSFRMGRAAFQRASSASGQFYGICQLRDLWHRSASDLLAQVDKRWIALARGGFRHNNPAPPIRPGQGCS